MISAPCTPVTTTCFFCQLCYIDRERWGTRGISSADGLDPGPSSSSRDVTPTPAKNLTSDRAVKQASPIPACIVRPALDILFEKHRGGHLRPLLLAVPFRKNEGYVQNERRGPVLRGGGGFASSRFWNDPSIAHIHACVAFRLGFDPAGWVLRLRPAGCPGEPVSLTPPRGTRYVRGPGRHSDSWGFLAPTAFVSPHLADERGGGGRPAFLSSSLSPPSPFPGPNASLSFGLGVGELDLYRDETFL